MSFVCGFSFFFIHMIHSLYCRIGDGGADMIIQNWTMWIRAGIVWEAELGQISDVFIHIKKKHERLNKLSMG